MPGKADQLPLARVAANVLSRTLTGAMPSLTPGFGRPIRRFTALSSPQAEDTPDAADDETATWTRLISAGRASAENGAVGS